MDLWIISVLNGEKVISWNLPRVPKILCGFDLDSCSLKREWRNGRLGVGGGGHGSVPEID
jgi:hypothetical protein